MDVELIYPIFTMLSFHFCKLNIDDFTLSVGMPDDFINSLAKVISKYCIVQPSSSLS